MGEVEAFLTDWIREYSDHFVLSFRENDPSLVRPYCHIPSMRLTQDGVKVMATAEEVDAHWAAAHVPLRPLDYHNSILHTVDVKLLNPGAAFITVDCGRYNVRNEEIMRFYSSYTVCKTAEGWKITSWIGHNPPGQK